MTIQPLARLKSTAPTAGRHEQRVVLKGEYRGGPGLRNGPPRPVSRPNAPLATDACPFWHATEFSNPSNLAKESDQDGYTSWALRRDAHVAAPA